MNNIIKTFYLLHFNKYFSGESDIYEIYKFLDQLGHYSENDYGVSSYEMKDFIKKYKRSYMSLDAYRRE